MNRRDFLHWLIKSGFASSLPFSIQGVPMQAFARSPYFNAFAEAGYNSGRVLVLIQMFGGNDGLNTLVPYADDIYYQRRPTIAISSSNVLRLPQSQTPQPLGFHPQLSELYNLYNDGKVCLVQGVGYENPNRSHFKSTDIWMTGSEAVSVQETGWLGRFLQMEYPGFPDELPSDPLAVQIGSSLALALQSETGGMGIALQDPEEFYALVNAGQDPPEGELDPQTPAQYELEFVRHIHREAKQYAGQVRDAAIRADNTVDYPSFSIARQLQIVARLIAGGLQTGVYLVGYSGFDTHSNQASRHETLLRYLSQSVHAFQQDLQSLGVADRVITMTFSEFGRRLKENGSDGTDHGTAAPMFLIGNNVGAGIVGSNPNLSNLDRTGDFIYDYDFRQVYTSVLSQWFEVSQEHLDLLFEDTYSEIPVIAETITGIQEPAAGTPNTYQLIGNYPNPFNPDTRIRFQTAGGHVRIVLYNVLGKEIAVLVDRRLSPGIHDVPFHAGHLSSGTYYYRMTAGDFTQTRKMTVLK